MENQDYQEIKMRYNDVNSFVQTYKNTKNRNYKVLVVLYGSQNFGKTTFLKDLIQKLTSIPPKVKGDVRCRFHRKGNLYCICTGGDNKQVIDANIASFESCANDPSPLIAITAARVGTRGRSKVADTLDDYSKYIRVDTFGIIWIKIDRLYSSCAKQLGIGDLVFSKNLKNNSQTNTANFKVVYNKALDTIVTQLTNIEAL